MSEEAPSEPAVSGEVVAAQLSAEEARALTDQALEQAAALWATLLRLYEGEAHLALGYASWGAYFREEFGKSAGQGYRLLRAARVETEVSVHVDTLGMTEAQARVLVPLAEDVRAEIVRRVAEEGGFVALTAARVGEIRDEIVGVRHLVAGTLVWDERALRAAASAVVRVGGLSRAFAEVDGLRELSPDDAGQVRTVIASALRDVDHARRAAQDVIATLENAARALDERGDLPEPPFPFDSWEGLDREAGVPETRQMTLRDVLDRIRDEAVTESGAPEAIMTAHEPAPSDPPRSVRITASQRQMLEMILDFQERGGRVGIDASIRRLIARGLLHDPDDDGALTLTDAGRSAISEPGTRTRAKRPRLTAPQRRALEAVRDGLVHNANENRGSPYFVFWPWRIEQGARPRPAVILRLQELGLVDHMPVSAPAPRDSGGFRWKKDVILTPAGRAVIED